MMKMIKKWKKVTPIPPEFNGQGYLWDCPYCKKCITSGSSYPRLTQCPFCKKEVGSKDD